AALPNEKGPRKSLRSPEQYETNRESGLGSGLLPLLLVILATRKLLELGKHARLFLGRGFLALLNGLRLHDLREPVRGRLFGRQQRAAFFDLCALLGTVDALGALLDFG